MLFILVIIQTKVLIILIKGDFTAALDVAMLKKNNVKAVLTAAIGLDIRYESEDNIAHKIINAYDIDSYNIAQHFDDGINFI